MNEKPPMSAGLLDPARFECELDGKQVRLFTLRKAGGMVVSLTSYGARIVQILAPDRHGRLDDVMLGYDSIECIMAGSPVIGAFIGRYAGRLANTRFAWGGSSHALSTNAGPHCLHGGLKGSRFWVSGQSQQGRRSGALRAHHGGVVYRAGPAVLHRPAPRRIAARRLRQGWQA